MKKGALLILFLLLLPIVEATITVDGPSNTVYNIGDTATLTGVITTTKDILGQLKIDLQCQGNVQLFAKIVSIKKNQRVTFNEQLPLPLYFENTCVFKTSITENNLIIDEATSRTFTISKELQGKIAVDHQQAQLGETLTLTGEFYKLDGTLINGQATIYYKQGETITNIETTPIEEGKMTHEKNTAAQPPGTYTIQVQAQDNVGNQGTFALENIQLTNTLTVTHNLNNNHVLPGKNLDIKGTVQTQGTELAEGSITITTEDQTEETTINNGDYATSITLPQQIATGEHTLTITAKDTYGNIGTTTGTYTVDAVPTTLHFLLQEGTFAPEKEITYEAKILDQGEDLYKEDISITITDAKGNKLHQDTITSGTQQSYTLPKQAPPGNWKILAKSSIDEQEQNFYVKEIKTLDYQLQGNSLTITNTGNVPYKEPLKVTLEGFDRPVNIVRNINLDVGESDTINLASGTPTGAYTVNVGEKTFNDVNIEGQEKKDYSWVYYVILGLFVFVLLFIIMTKKITPIMNTTRKSYHAHDDHDHNEFIDPLLQEQLQRDLTRNRYQPAPRRTRTEHYPTLQTEDLNRFHSHGETTIFRKRREEKKQAAETNTHNPPSNNTFGGMFD